jgi:hypothetical protein
VIVGVWSALQFGLAESTDAAGLKKLDEIARSADVRHWDSLAKGRVVSPSATEEFFLGSTTRPPLRYVGPFQRGLLGSFLIAFAAVVCAALIGLWPAVTKATNDQASVAPTTTQTSTTGTATTGGTSTTPAGGTGQAAPATGLPASANDAALLATGKRFSVPLAFGLVHAKLGGDTALYVLVILASLLGALVHVASSFMERVSRRALTVSYLWWYPMRLVVGAALALIVYLVLRAGLLSGDFTTREINPYGIAAISALSGMFAKQATEKLAEVFKVIFATIGAATQRPAIRQLTPSEVVEGSDATPIRIQGSGFVPDANVTVNNDEVEATYVSATELAAIVPPELLAQVGDVNVVVSVAAGEESEPAVLRVVPKANGGADKTDAAAPPETEAVTETESAQTESVAETESVGETESAEAEPAETESAETEPVAETPPKPDTPGP